MATSGSGAELTELRANPSSTNVSKGVSESEMEKHSCAIRARLAKALVSVIV